MQNKKKLCYIVLKSHTDTTIEVLENDKPFRFCERNVGDILDKKFRWTIKDRIVKLLNEMRSEVKRGIKIIACVNDKPIVIFSQKMFLEERKDLQSKENYTMWKRSVYRKCGYKCAACGNSKEELHAHHIQSFRLYPKLRYKKSNGTCLCKNCHLEFHSTYGKICNSAEELSEFIVSKKPDVLF